MFTRLELELLTVVFGYFAVYLLLVDPIVGSIIGIGDPPFSHIHPGRPFTWVINARMWLMLLSGVPVFVGYLHFRPRIANEDPDEFWNAE